MSAPFRLVGALLAMLWLATGVARAQDAAETAVPHDELIRKIEEMQDYLQKQRYEAIGLPWLFVPHGQTQVPRLQPPKPRTDYETVLVRRMPKVLADFYQFNRAPLNVTLLNVRLYGMPISRADFDKLNAEFAQVKAYEQTLLAMQRKEDAIYSQEKSVLDRILAIHAAEGRIEAHFEPLFRQAMTQSLGAYGDLTKQMNDQLAAAGAPIPSLFRQLDALDQSDQALIKTYQRKVFITEFPGHVTGGSKVTPLVDGPEVFKRIDDLLNYVAAHGGPDDLPLAEGYVHISLWNCDLDTHLTPNETFFQALAKVVRAGAELRMTVWDSSAYGQIVHDGVDESNQDCVKRLNGLAGRSADGKRIYNVKAEFLEHDSTFGSYHQKYFIFNDGTESRAIVGGLNVDGAENGTPHHTKALMGIFNDVHDVAVEINGPAVDDVEDDFTAHWFYMQHADTFTSLHLRPLAHLASGNDKVTIAVTSPVTTVAPVHWYDLYTQPKPVFVSPPASIRQELLSNIAKAKDYIYIENYAVFDPAIISAIGQRIAQQKAAGHPLNVIIMVRHGSHADPYDFLHFLTYQHLSFMTCDQFAYEDSDGVHRVSRKTSGKTWKVTYAGKFYEDSEVHWDGGSAKLMDIVSFDHDQPLYTLVGWHHNDPKFTLMTQAVYIHSKVSIFDDQVAGVGSANFNPRSMTKDGELTAFIEGPAAAELRKKLWGEYFPALPTPAQWPAMADANAKAGKSLATGRLYVLPLRPPTISHNDLDDWKGSYNWVRFVRNRTDASDY